MSTQLFEMLRQILINLIEHTRIGMVRQINHIQFPLQDEIIHWDFN